jgi:hypothetical protein
MSSELNSAEYLTSDLSLLRRVSKGAGYAPNASIDGKRVPLAAASLPDQSGTASPTQTEGMPKRQPRELGPPRHPKIAALHRYAIQGLPRRPA